MRVNFNDDLQDAVVEKSLYEAFPTSLVARHLPLSVPGYSALLFQDGGRQSLLVGVYQNKGNRAADRADQTSRRVDWEQGYFPTRL